MCGSLVPPPDLIAVHANEGFLGSVNLLLQKITVIVKGPMSTDGIRPALRTNVGQALELERRSHH